MGSSSRGPSLAAMGLDLLMIGLTVISFLVLAALVVWLDKV
jgi:hypothetical protein